MLSAKLWFLRQLGANNRLPEEVLDEIKNEGRIERWGHGATIYQDTTGSELYMIMGGQVHVDDGTPANSLMLRRGDVFGGRSTTESTQAPEVPGLESAEGAILKAFDETTLLAVETETFRDLTRDYLGHLQARTSFFGTDKVLIVPVMPLVGTPPGSRLARVLLQLLEDHGTIAGDQGVFGQPLKSRTLARLTGLDRSRVSLLLDIFRAENLLQFDGRVATAPSIKALQGWALGEI